MDNYPKPNVEHPQRRRTILLFALGLIPLIACGAVALFCQQLLYGTTFDLASVDLEGDYRVRIFVEALGFQNPRWDPDHGNNASIYYEITQSDRIIVSKSFVTIYPSDYRNQIRVITSEDGKLVAVYDMEQWLHGLFFLFDVTNPEILQYTRSVSSATQQEWRERYEALLAANPDMPNYFH